MRESGSSKSAENQNAHVLRHLASLVSGPYFSVSKFQFSAFQFLNIIVAQISLACGVRSHYSTVLGP